MLKNLENIDTRIKKSFHLTLQIAKYLENKNIPVNFPLLESHSSYNKAIKYFNGLGPSVLTFKVEKSKKEALIWMKTSDFECSTRFGSKNTKFDQWPTYHNGFTTCRLSVGYNDNYDSIIKKLEKMFTNI